jgi:hypothetical protein
MRTREIIEKNGSVKGNLGEVEALSRRKEGRMVESPPLHEWGNTVVRSQIRS